MCTYLLQRILQAIPILVGISIISFLIIQLPPGDYLTTYVNNLRSQGDTISDEEVKALEQQYGLDSPAYVQYWKWVSNFMRGNMGQSFYWNKPVRDLRICLKGANHGQKPDSFVAIPKFAMAYSLI